MAKQFAVEHAMSAIINHMHCNASLCILECNQSGCFLYLAIYCATEPEKSKQPSLETHQVLPDNQASLFDAASKTQGGQHCSKDVIHANSVAL